ncbi:hypothetical protein FVE67_03715 [Thermosulfurimonas marina]|uniref:Deoxyhypusine synthase n=1 Tax=Thermosulfurimonas marina TaxID=2047767 RepID=A0A6H1WRV9_9BACT|nr:hypothetical protein [Thermosulfurimonas marina]QJA05957.1 hypothetical protein FVE67_03715 [Thermosulfurimonas marina]
MGKRPEPLSFEDLRTYSLFERPSKVSVEKLGRPLGPGRTLREFLRALPKELAARDLLDLAREIVRARKRDRPVIWAFGAHVIKVGASPYLLDLMERGLVTALATNGASMVHDAELAMCGNTSEDVAAALRDGSFGAAKETGELLNEAARLGARGQGLGWALGKLIAEGNFPYKHLSLFARAYELGVPLTVHVAIGTDIVHIHPSAEGAAIGEATYLDFRIFCRLVSELEGGVFVLSGSAVLLPEVFLKALSAVRNLGHRVEHFVTANLDFLRQYRPLTNVVHRPTLSAGKGYSITGHHEILIPLLHGAVVEMWEGEDADL